MTTQTLIDNFLNHCKEAEVAAKEFINLSYNQIKWRPAESVWSIGECFEHLIRTNEKYIPEFLKYKLQGNEKIILPFKSTLLGKFIMKSVMPQYKRKFKTALVFNPIGSSLRESIIKDFLKLNNEIVEAVKNIDHSKLKEKISSPFSKFIKYSIGDSLMIIAYHNLRHIQQAKRVRENEKFPSA